MKKNKPPFTQDVMATILRINLSFLQSVFFTSISLGIWSLGSSYIGMIFMAGIFALVAFASLAQALIGIFKLYRNKKTTDDFLKEKRTPSQSSLVSDEELTKAGMDE